MLEIVMVAPALQAAGYLPVPTASLSSSSVLEFDLYLQRPGRAVAELYRGTTYPLEDKDIAELRREGVDRLYIKSDSAQAYRRYLRSLLGNSKISPAVRINALRDLTRVAFQDALATSDHGRLVAVASEFGSEVANVLVEHAIPFRDLWRTLEHDFYTFTHVCNVGVYSALMARKLGFADSNELAQIATGALLHDIGKRHVPASVLNKKGKLTEEEWELVRGHPVSGFRELMTRPELSWAQLMMVYQHHEKMDGSGYPTGVTGEEIHPWARICCVVDVFDALTCCRPYRKAVPKLEVCEHLEKHAGTWFDAELVAEWTKQLRSSSS
jgi:HD-GYP domain-containing protein (c-di-GMP phosphodiesterase class II)